MRVAVEARPFKSSRNRFRTTNRGTIPRKLLDNCFQFNEMHYTNALLFRVRSNRANDGIVPVNPANVCMGALPATLLDCGAALYQSETDSRVFLHLFRGQLRVNEQREFGAVAWPRRVMIPLAGDRNVASEPLEARKDRIFTFGL